MTNFSIENIEEHLSKKNNAIIGMIAIILFVTLLFEQGYHALVHKLEHTHMHHMLRMLRALTKQLTVLGCIGLSLFWLVQTGFMQKLNDNLLHNEQEIERVAKEELNEEGENPYSATTPLTEIFEIVQNMIFCMMFLYISTIMVYLYLSSHTGSQWKSYEQINFNQFKAEVENPQLENTNLFKYWILRQRFFNRNNPFGPRPKGKIDFSEYLSEQLGKTLETIVNFPFTSWVILLLLTVLISPILQFPSMIRAILLLVFSLFIIAASCWAWSITNHALNQLTPDLDDVRRCVLSANSQNQFEEAMDSLKAPFEVRAFVKKNKCPGLQGTQIISCQEQILPFGSSGRSFLLRALQLLTFLTVAQITVCIACLTSQDWNDDLFSITGIAIAVVPIFLLLLSALTVLPAAAQNFAIFTSLELMTDSATLQQLTKKNVKKALLRQTQIIEYMATLGRIRDLELKSDASILDMRSAENLTESLYATARPDSRMMGQFNEQSVSSRRALQEAFEAFSNPEIRSLLDEEGLRKMCNVLNLSPNFHRFITEELTKRGAVGDIYGMTFAKFANLATAALCHKKHPPFDDDHDDDNDDDDEELRLIRSIFIALDIDRDHSISVDDLSDAMRGLIPPLSAHEASLILDECGDGRQGLIANEEEFTGWFLEVSSRLNWIHNKGHQKILLEQQESDEVEKKSHKTSRQQKNGSDQSSPPSSSSINDQKISSIKLNNDED